MANGEQIWEQADGAQQRRVSKKAADFNWIIISKLMSGDANLPLSLYSSTSSLL